MNLTLKRFMSTSDGTFGVLRYDDRKFYTVEKPWDRNIQEISCVPDGEYSLMPHQSNKYGDVLCLINREKGVTHFKEEDSKRYACLIHVANFAKDVKGCIGLGDAYLGDMVTNSRQAILDFYNEVSPNEIHNIVVSWEEEGV